MQQFKVGDWVTTKAGYTKQISRLTGDKCDTLSIGNASVGINVVFKNEIELWQPKEGEWCWFKDSKNTIGTLVRLVGIEEDGTYYGYTSYGMQDKAPCVEPFIGELPSFLKEQ